MLFIEQVFLFYETGEVVIGLKYERGFTKHDK